MTICNVNVAAAGASRFVRDDGDRVALLAYVGRAFGAALLAHCVMDTHLHVVVEAPEEVVTALLHAALAAYARTFNARHRTELPLLRGPIDVREATDAGAIARAIRYVHRNPFKTDPPIVKHDVHFPWSSARVFAGLARTAFPNVIRVRELVGNNASWALPGPWPLEPADARASPSETLPVLAAAVAQTFGLLVENLASARRAPRIVAARAAFVHLGRLESYSDRQLASVLGRSRSQANALFRKRVDVQALRIARTLLGAPALRCWVVPADSQILLT